jgi:transposase
MSDEVRAAIETVVIDCHWPYRRAIEEALPRARIVVDKFHIIRAVDAAAQRVRSRLGKRQYRQRIGHGGGITRQHNPANNPTIFRARWVFMKRADKLSDTEREWLWAVFEASVDELRRAWVLKELFASIYDAPDRLEAERRLNDWIDAITRAGIPEFLNTWRTLQWWREQILNYFDDRVTNAFAEGVTTTSRSSSGAHTGSGTRSAIVTRSCSAVVTDGAGMADPPFFAKSPSNPSLGGLRRNFFRFFPAQLGAHVPLYPVRASALMPSRPSD